jgi:hypothetical protein
MLADDPAQQGLLSPGRAVSDRQLMQQQQLEQPQQQHNDGQQDQLLLVDLVSFDHCQEVSHALAVVAGLSDSSSGNICCVNPNLEPPARSFTAEVAYCLTHPARRCTTVALPSRQFKAV